MYFDIAVRYIYRTFNTRSLTLHDTFLNPLPFTTLLTSLIPSFFFFIILQVAKTTVSHACDFWCHDRTTCIAGEQRCDGIKHCEDGEDEEGCIGELIVTISTFFLQKINSF